MMKINIGNRVEVNGENISAHNCLVCGEQLTLKEYTYGKDECVECRTVNRPEQHKGYVSVDGANNIDEILLNKVGRK